MPYKMAGRRRVWVEEDNDPVVVPQKQIGSLMSTASAGVKSSSNWKSKLQQADASALAEQLRAQAPGVQWSIKGRDTADELARFLAAKGVTSLEGLKLGTKTVDIPGGFAYYGFNEGGENQGPWTPPRQESRTFLDFGGGVILGNEGDIYSEQAREDYLNNGNEFAESNVGDGGVSFRYQQTPDGRIQLVPKWQSSSDMGKVRDALKIGAVALGGLGLAGIGPLSGLGTSLGAAPSASGAGAITGGGGLTAGGSAGYGTIGGTLGGTGGTTLGVAGGGLSAGAGLTSPLLQSLGAISAGSVLPASLQPMGGLLDGLPAIAADPLPAIEAFTAANPVAVPELLAGVPEIVAPAVSAAPSVFNAAADSQAYNAAAGITGAEAAAAANVPATVNLANAGGAMSTAGGLSGLLQSGGQMAADAVGAAKDAISPTLQWMKDNPTLGRLLLGGATSLLSSAGGGGSQAAAEAPAGPPVQWKSPIQQGLLAPVQQYAPEAIQKRPAGLLASGYENDGAWRYLRG